MQWEGKTYGIPLNTNVQLLWYRKDLVPKPPETWDELIAMAKKLPAGEGNILEQGNKYEGYVVWFNNLVASAGGEIVNAEGEPALGRRPPSRRRRSSRTSRPPVASTRRCRRCRRTRSGWLFEAGKGAFMLNWPFVYASARTAAETGDATAKKVFENMGYARFPGVNKGEPSKVSIGGANLGVVTTGEQPGARDQGRAVHDQREVAGRGGHQRGAPAGHELDLRRPGKVREVYPFADLLREQLRDSVVRPATPSYSDVTLAIQDTLHPPASVNPQPSISTLGDRLQILADGGMY